MSSNYNTIDVEPEEIEYKSEMSHSIHSILKILTTFCYTYQLLYCRGHIQMTSNYSSIEVEAEDKKNVKMLTSYSIYFGFLLHYMTLTNYYIVEDTFR